MNGGDFLAVDANEMRRMAELTVAKLVERLSNPASTPTLRRATRAEMDTLIHTLPAATAADFERLLDKLFTDVVAYTSRTDHPRYFAFIPGCGTWAGALGDFIASACNIYAGSWLEAAGPSELELTVIDWFRTWIGYPPTASGSLLSGGSAANMTALACAREALAGPMSDKLVIYVSDQAHSSIARAARILGFRPDQVRVIPVDAEFRLSPALVEMAMRADESRGLRPLFLVGSGGSTNAGAVDPLSELAAVAASHNAWFHVDAAYGGFAALTERGKRLLAGLERADSVTMDPHKWFFQPFECGALLVRDGELLRKAFEIAPDYLLDQRTSSGEVNFCDLGFQLSRATRAFKVWLSVQFFGLDAFRAAIDRALDLAEHAQQRIVASRRLQLLRAASLGIVCFRRRVDGAEEQEAASVNQGLLDRLNATGEAFVSSTRLHGRYAIRLCILNHTTTAPDVDWVLDWLETAPFEAPSDRTSAVDVFERNPGEPSAWLASQSTRSLPAGRVTLDEVRNTLLARTLTADKLQALINELFVQSFESGEVILERFSYGRDFYVVARGAADVLDNSDAVIRTLEPGDHFGELAAMEWGAGYSYPRTAQVVAKSRARLIVVPQQTFAGLMTTEPRFAEEIQSTARERLKTI